MNLQDILVMWERDADIDDNHLDRASLETPKLHSKYLQILIEAKSRRIKTDMEYNVLRKTKLRYYRGELSRDELKNLGWEQWQYAKPLKAEMEEILGGDEDLAKIKTRLDYIDTMVYALEQIMNQIKARDWSIKNSIQWKMFIAGN